MARNTFYSKRAPEGPDPIGQTAQARPASGVRPAHSVVLDYHRDRTVVGSYGHRDGRR